MKSSLTSHVEEGDENNNLIKRIPRLSNAVVHKFSKFNSIPSYEDMSPPTKIHEYFAPNLETNNNNNNNKKTGKKNQKVSFSSVNEEEEDGILRIRQECNLCGKKTKTKIKNIFFLFF